MLVLFFNGMLVPMDKKWRRPKNDPVRGLRLQESRSRYRHSYWTHAIRPAVAVVVATLRVRNDLPAPA